MDNTDMRDIDPSRVAAVMKASGFSFQTAVDGTYILNFNASEPGMPALRVLVATATQNIRLVVRGQLETYYSLDACPVVQSAILRWQATHYGPTASAELDGHGHTCIKADTNILYGVGATDAQIATFLHESFSGIHDLLTDLHHVGLASATTNDQTPGAAELESWLHISD